MYTGNYNKLWFDSIIEPRALVREYNDSAHTEQKKREEILEKLIANIGKECILEPPIRIDNGENVTLGDNFYSNYNLTLLDYEKIIFGKNCYIGPNVVITSASHPLHPTQRKRLDERAMRGSKPIIIEDSVWVGANCTILPGVTIGYGSIIAAGSVVNKSIPPMSVAGGAPCKVIREITDDDLIPD